MNTYDTIVAALTREIRDRGMTLPADEVAAMATRVARELKEYRTAIHEAAHAVVVRAVGDSVKDVTIAPGPDYTARVRATETKPPDNSIGREQRRALSNIAGPLGVYIHNGDVPDEGCKADLAMFAAMVNCDESEGRQRINEAGAILCEHWEIVERLADALMVKQTLDKEESTRLLEPVPVYTSAQLEQLNKEYQK